MIRQTGPRPWYPVLPELPADLSAILPAPDGRLRVALHTPCLLRGGAERWILDLLASVDPSRIQWIGIGVFQRGACDREQRAIAERTCPVVGGAGPVRALAEAADVLLTWGIPGWWQWVPEALWARTLVVSHGTGPYTECVLAGCERGVPVAVAGDALRSVPAAEQGRCRVIYNGVGRDRLAAQEERGVLRARWGVPEEARVLGFLARLSGEKRPLAVPETLAHLPEGWHGVLCGQGLEAARVRRRALQLGVADRCHLPGYTEDAGGALRAFDALLIPSDMEGYCYSGVEAWLLGVPTLWTPTGMARECPELVRGVPLGASGAEIATALLADQEDVVGTAARVARARAVAEERFTLASFGTAWTETLTGVASSYSTK